MIKTMLLITVLVIISLSVIVQNKKYRKNEADNTNQYRTVKSIAVILVLFICVLSILGYRINPLAAAKANAFIDNDMSLIDELHIDWADIYFFYDNKDNMYRTAISEKKLFFYVSHNSVWLYNHKEDLVRTIGSMSYTNDKGKSIIALLIESMDNDVDYIEAKLDNEVVRTKVMTRKPIILSFGNSNRINELELIAYNNDDKGLYYYGYPKGTTYLKSEDYKWHIIED